MKDKVQEAIDQVRPGLQADGGDVELVDVTEDGVVKGPTCRCMSWMRHVSDDIEDGDRAFSEGKNS